MAHISAAVGEAQVNKRSDVKTVQVLLNKNITLLTPFQPLQVTGTVEDLTKALITVYQRRVLRLARPDGIVHPKGRTLRALTGHAAPHRPDKGSKSSPGTETPGGLSESEFVDAAKAIGCEPAAVKAVVETEVGIRGPFDAEGRPTILFERHYFSRLTGGKYDKADSDISNPISGGYGKFSAQYPKLERAMKLDKEAGLRSASWGACQIMGDNYAQAGFGDVNSFVAAMKSSVHEQMKAFIAFVLASKSLKKALVHKDWTNFAKIYNGPGYAANNYDATMKENYKKYVGKHP